MPPEVGVQLAFSVMEIGKGFIGAVQSVPEFIDARTELQIGQRQLVSSARANPMPSQYFMLDADHRVASNISLGGEKREVYRIFSLAVVVRL